MTKKMYEIIDLPHILSKIKSQKLPFKYSYKIALFVTEVQKHLDFYQESFDALIVEYSKKDEEGKPMPTEDGKGVLLKEETMEEAYKKLDELRSVEVELPDTKLPIDAFETIEISPEEMMIIMPFIEA